MFSAKIISDSVGPAGNRLTTVEAKYPRFIHSEIMTHRMFSRNAASSRAVPVKQKIQEVRENPVIPIHWGLAQSGMQARQEVSIEVAEIAEQFWLQSAKNALLTAECLKDAGIHKQIINRVLEPYTWITVIISSTSWEHFFKLRVHEDAEPHMQHIAALIYRAMEDSRPKPLERGEWHLPYISLEDRKEESDQKKLAAISVARCARVSYLTHDGKRDHEADLKLHDRLAKSGHWSPFEHVAKAFGTSVRSGNFTGFQQYRKEFENEFLQERLYSKG